MIKKYKFYRKDILTWPVYENGKIVLQAGTTDVDIAFNQSTKTWKNDLTGKTSNQNVYRHNGILYNE